MQPLTILDLPVEAYDALHKLAALRSTSIESIARQLLTEAIRPSRPPGIDFAALQKHRAEFGLIEDGPAWDDEFNAFATLFQMASVSSTQRDLP